MRRALKVVIFVAVVTGLSTGLGRPCAMGFPGVMLAAVLVVHGCVRPKTYGVNGWTGEPKEPYYRLRGWDS